MSEPDWRLLMELVRKLTEDMRSVRDDQQAMREEMKEMRHDLEAQIHDLRLEMKDGFARVDRDIANLRQTVFAYHSSVIGQGALITELDLSLIHI